MAPYSQASNGQGFANSGVDPQSGFYSHTIPLISLGSLDQSANNVRRDIKLKYSVLSAALAGFNPFSTGWTMTGIGSYDVNRGVFVLSDNRQFTVDKIMDNVVSFHDRKTKDFVVQYDPSTASYRVLHKDGVVEIFYLATKSGDANPMHFLQTLVFPSGEAYRFDYITIGDARYLNMVSVYENNQRTISMLTLKYDGESYLESVSVYRGAHGIATANFYISQFGGGSFKALTGYQRLGTTDIVSIAYSQDNDANCYNFRFITGVTYPEGGSEEITVDTIPQYYKNSASQEIAIPRVLKFTVSPGHSQPDIVQQFGYPPSTYDEENDVPAYANFLGYPNTYGWSDNADNMYNWSTATSYKYWVEVTSGITTPSVTKTFYNAFHLKTKEIRTCKLCKVVTSYTYRCDEEDYKACKYDEQPENLLFPTAIKKRFVYLDPKDGVTETNQSTEYVSKMETDIYGNHVKNIAPTEVTQDFEYYDISGETVEGVVNCPADPFNSFERFLKKMTITGAADSINDKPLKKETVMYFESFCQLSNSLTQFDVIKPCKVEIGDGTSTYATLEASYIKDPDVPFKHNQYDEISCMMHGENNESWKTSCSFAITTSDNNTLITTEHTCTGFDSKTYKESKTKTAYTDLVTKFVNRENMTFESEYNVVGKITSSKYASGTTNEAITTMEYITKNETTNGPSVVVTEPNGMKMKIEYDGMGQICAASRTPRDKADSDTFLTFVEQSYNDSGQISSVTHQDWDNENNSLCKVTSKRSYDGWGLKCRDTTDDGVIDITVNDPIHLCSAKTLAHTGEVADIQTAGALVGIGLAVRTTKYNTFQKPTGTTTIRTNGDIFSTKIEYDGFGRKASLTSAEHKTATLGYDIFNRLTSVSLPGGSILDVTYAPHSHRKLLCGVQITDQQNTLAIGTQVFDGINRLTKRSVSGLDTYFSYFDGTLTKPSQVNTPSGNVITYTFNEGMKDAPESISSWRGAPTEGGSPEEFTEFSYASTADGNSNTKLLRAENEAGKYEMEYSSGGYLCKQTFTQTDGNTCTTTYDKVSLLGRPLQTSVTVGSQTTKITYVYDTYGRQILKQQGDLSIHMEYDKFGRSTIETVKCGGVERQRTEKTFDDMNRENSRTVSLTSSSGTSTNLSLAYGYNNDGKVTGRKLSVDGVERRNETFELDEVNRITKYKIEDGFDKAYLPTSGVGSAKIVGLDYTFDIGDRITSVTSYFSDKSTDTATITYDATIAMRIKSITHSLSEIKDVTFTYDDDGNISEISNGDDSVKMVHSIPGRLSEYWANGIQTEAYKYDAFQRFISDGDFAKHYFEGQIGFESPVGQPGSSSVSQIVRYKSKAFAEVDDTGAPTFLASDKSSSCVASMSPSDAIAYNNYSPYGHASIDSKTGFQGYYRNRKAPVYMPGNGVRTYLPVLCSFAQMDSFSPFRCGGLNPYIFCQGGPVDNVDPSGHFSAQADLGLNVFSLFMDLLMVGLSIFFIPETGGLSVLEAFNAFMSITSDITGIAADSLTIQDEKNGTTEHSDTAAALGITSGVTGILSMVTGSVFGVGEVADDALQAGMKGTSPHMAESFENSNRMKTNSDRAGSRKSSHKTSEHGGYASKTCDAPEKDLRAEPTTLKFDKEILKGSYKPVLNSVLGIDIDLMHMASQKTNPIVRRAWNTVAVGEAYAGIAGILLLYNTTWSMNGGSPDDQGNANNDKDAGKEQDDDMEVQALPSSTLLLSYP